MADERVENGRGPPQQNDALLGHLAPSTLMYRIMMLESEIAALERALHEGRSTTLPDRQCANAKRAVLEDELAWLRRLARERSFILTVDRGSE